MCHDVPLSSQSHSWLLVLLFLLFGFLSDLGFLFKQLATSIEDGFMNTYQKRIPISSVDNSD